MTVGATVEPGGVRFCVFAPGARAVEIVPHEGAGPEVALARDEDGFFTGLAAGAERGFRYKIRVDGRGPFPDPASRFQPEGVHGPSKVVDPSLFEWKATAWRGVALEDVVFYEMHVGTFSPEGTFRGAEHKLGHLKDLGVTALEIMPVADFPGRRNWGYDGVSLFSPARCYGAPDDLRRLVDAAHRLELAVFLDVVHNHLGPDGNYLSGISPDFFTDRHETPWGQAVNLDGKWSAGVRRFLVENALHWIREYRFDGLRLDATHALIDDSPRNYLAELADAVRAATPEGHRVHLVAEDHRNLDLIVRSPGDGGYGLDGLWADDFHHEVRRMVAGDDEGYYRDFRGDANDLAAILEKGWLYCGAFSKHMGHARGTEPRGIPPARFVVCVQNHDQIGNRAMGDRLHHGIDPAAFRAATALLLSAPQTPLLFMGEEWAASSPFLFFTDHEEGLGKLVTEGRRKEFRHFRAFADPATREKIPDPQADSTFRRSRLDWNEIEEEPHAAVLRLHRKLLALRKTLSGAHAVEASGPDAVLLRRGASVLVVARLRGAGAIEFGSHAIARGRRFETMLLSTEDPAFAPDSRPIALTGEVARFERPGALILRDAAG